MQCSNCLLYLYFNIAGDLKGVIDAAVNSAGNASDIPSHNVCLGPTHGNTAVLDEQKGSQVLNEPVNVGTTDLDVSFQSLTLEDFESDKWDLISEETEVKHLRNTGIACIQIKYSCYVQNYS